MDLCPSAEIQYKSHVFKLRAAQKLSFCVMYQQGGETEVKITGKSLQLCHELCDAVNELKASDSLLTMTMLARVKVKK